MKTQAILYLSFFLYWSVVSSKFGRREFNERDAVGVDRKTSSKQVNTAGGAGFLSDQRPRRSLESGQQKSRANGNGLRSRGTRSTREASSGTDWGGLFLGIPGSQRTDSEKNKTPFPVISWLVRELKEIDSALRETGRKFRRRRSTWDSPNSKPVTEATIAGIDAESRVAGTSSHATEMGDIIANTKAKLSTVGSDGGGNFFGPDWFFFVSPNSMEILSKSLYKSSPKVHETETQKAERHYRPHDHGPNPIHGSSNDLSIDGSSDAWNIATSSRANRDKKVIEKQSSFPGSNEHRFSQWRSDLYGEHSDYTRPWPGKHYEIPTSEETEYTSRYKIHPAWYLADTRESDSRANDRDSKSEHSFGGIEYGNEYEEYSDRDPPYEESALSGANTFDLQNRRPGKNKPQFVTDPRSLLARLEGHTGRTFSETKRDKAYGSISFLNKELDFDGNVRKLTAMSDQNYGDSYLDATGDRNRRTGILQEERDFEEPKVREMVLRLAEAADGTGTENLSNELKFEKALRTNHEETFGSRGFEHRSPTDSRLVFAPREQHNRHRSITGAYEISQSTNGEGSWKFDDESPEHDALDYLKSSKERLDRAKKHETKNGRKLTDDGINLALNSPRIDESTEIDSRENIHEKYDKHESAAETSIHTHAEANKHGRVKHRESIEEESTSAKEIRDETVKQREPWRNEKHNIPGTENRKRHGIDLDENTKDEWTPLDTGVEIINRAIENKDSGAEESDRLFSKVVDKLSGERERVEPREEKRKRAKDEEYENQRFVDSTAASDDEKYKEYFSNIGVKNAQKSLYVNHRDSSEVPNSTEAPDQSKNLAKEEHEIASGQESSIKDVEYKISENEDKENGKDTLREKWEHENLDNDETLAFDKLLRDATDEENVTNSNDRYKIEMEIPIDAKSVNEDKTKDLSPVVGEAREISLVDNYLLQTKNLWPEVNKKEENNKWNKLDKDRSTKQEENNEKLKQNSNQESIESDQIYEENDTTLKDNVYNARGENHEIIIRPENEAETTKELNAMWDKVTSDVTVENTASETLRNSEHEDETVRDQTTNLSAITSAPSVTDFGEDVFSVANSGAQVAKIGDENGAHQSSEADTSEVQSTANVDSDAGASAIIRYGATTDVDNQGKIDTHGSRMDLYELRAASVPTTEQTGDSRINGNVASDEESSGENEAVVDLRDSKALKTLNHGTIRSGKNTLVKYEGTVTDVGEENENKRKLGSKSPVQAGEDALAEYSEGLVTGVGEESRNERKGETKPLVRNGVDALAEYSEGLVSGVGEKLKNERKVETKSLVRNGVDALANHDGLVTDKGKEDENEQEVETKPRVQAGIDALAKYDKGLVRDPGEEYESEDKKVRTTGDESSLNWKSRESSVGEILRALNNSEEKKRGNKMAEERHASIGEESAADAIKKNYKNQALRATTDELIRPAVKSEKESESSSETSSWLEHTTKEDESAVRKLNEEWDSGESFAASMRSIIDKLKSNDLNKNDKKYTKKKSAKSSVSWIPEIESKKSEENILGETSSAGTEGREMARDLNIHISPESLIKSKVAETQRARRVENGLNLEQLSVSYPTSSYVFTGNSDTAREGHISPVTISQGSEEELEERKTVGQSVVDHLFGRHNSERISHSSLINGERNDTERREEKNEMSLATKNELFAPKLKERNIEGNALVGDRVSKLLSSLNAENGATQTLKEWENNIFSKKNDKTSLAKGESIARRLNAKEAYEKRPGASIEATESNDVTEESEESSSDSRAIKDVSVGGVEANDVSRTNKYGVYDLSKGAHNEARRAGSKENESTARNSELEGWKVPSARPLIGDNESKLNSIEDVQNSSNTETSSEVHPWDPKGDSIVHRLTQGSTSRSNPWTDNERYKGLLAETNRIHEDAPSNIEMGNHRTEHLPKLRSMIGSDEENKLLSVKAYEEEEEEEKVEASSEKKDRKNASRVKEIEAKEDLENLRGRNIHDSRSENIFNKAESSHENGYKNDNVRQEERKRMAHLVPTSDKLNIYEDVYPKSGEWTTESEKENSLSDVSRENSNRRHESIGRDNIMELLRTVEGSSKTTTEVSASDRDSERKFLEGFADSKGKEYSSILREKQNDKLGGDKSYRRLGDYEDKLHDFIPGKEFGEHFYVTPPPEIETQIRRPLGEAEISTTLSPRWIQHVGGNILKKGDETGIPESDDTSHQNLFQGTSRAHTRITDRDEYSDNLGQSDSTSNINMNSNDDMLQGEYLERKIIQDKPRHGIQSYLKNKQDKGSVLDEANESIESYYKPSNIDGNLREKYADFYRSNLKDEDRDREGHHELFRYPKNEEVDTSSIFETNTKEEDRDSEGHQGLFRYPKKEEVDKSNIFKTNTKEEDRDREGHHELFRYPKNEDVDTSSIFKTNTKEEDRDSEGHHRLFRYPKKEEADKSSTFRTNTQEEDKDNKEQHGRFRYLKNEGINVNSEFPNSKWSQRITSDETNDRESSPTTQSSENLYRSSNEKEESIGTNDYLFYSSGASSSSETGEGISGTKFARKLQPSSWKFAKPTTELEYKSEPFVPAPSEPFNPYPDGKGTTEYARPSSSVSSDQVLSSEVTNDDLRTFLTTVLSAPSPEDANSGELADIYDVSNDGKSSYRLDKAKTDVYIVKRKSKGPVKITHVEHVKPFLTRSDLIPIGVYEQMRDIYKKNRLRLSLQQRAAGI